ncbi:MAG: ketoacyl-ACP synthase III [Rhodobacter sp.]|nr:ketoacyl-ACP synthase III [Rhodobacter sp.]
MHDGSGQAPFGGTVSIRDVSVAKPSRIETDAEFADALGPVRHKLLQRHVGVEARHIADEDETALDLSVDAAETLLDRHAGLRERLDVLIVCTQSPDYVLPPNSCLLHGRLGLAPRVAAFDVPHACSAYIYALLIARGLAASGSAREILIVTADTYSRYLHPQDRSTRAVFGDGAAATWVSVADGGRGVLDVVCGTDGTGFDKFYIPAGGTRQPVTDALRAADAETRQGNVRSPDTIHMAGGEMLAFVRDSIPDHIAEVLDRNGVTLQDLSQIFLHQASSVVLDTIVSCLGVAEDRVPRNLARHGNLVSTSIPALLDDALRAERLAEGDLVLLCGFGAGLSWGSALVRW